MIPDTFDPLYAALGIRRRDWLKTPVTPQPSRACAHLRGDAC